MGSGNCAVILALRGNLTVSRIDEICAEVLASLEAHSVVALDCAQAEEVDIAFLQLLIAANRAAEELGKSVRFDAPPSGVLADAIGRCGFPPTSPTTSLAQTFSLPFRHGHENHSHGR